MQDCIFCKIVGKQIPASIVYEDERTLAFLDINPLTEGHTLIIPKIHAENIFDIPAEDLKHISVVAQQISDKMKESIDAAGVDLIQASGVAADQTVPHFHLHIIPRKDGDNLQLRDWWLSKAQKSETQKLLEIAKKLQTEKIEEEQKKVEEKIPEEKPKERSKEEAEWIKRELEIA